MQIVHLMIEIERGPDDNWRTGPCRRRSARPAVRSRVAFARIEPARDRIQLRRGGKSNMFCICAMWLTCTRSRMFMPFLIAWILIAVEVRRALLELGEVLDRSQAALRAMDLLVEDAAQAGGVEAEAAFLRPHVRESDGTARWCGRSRGNPGK